MLGLLFTLGLGFSVLFPKPDKEQAERNILWHLLPVFLAFIPDTSATSLVGNLALLKSHFFSSKNINLYHWKPQII